MDKEESLSEDDELVQTSRKLRCPSETEMKVNKKKSKVGKSKIK